MVLALNTALAVNDIQVFGPVPPLLTTEHTTTLLRLPAYKSWKASLSQGFLQTQKMDEFV